MLLRTVKDPRVGFVTITKVKVTEDYRLAKIQFSVPGSAEERERSIIGLNSARGYIRRELAKRINLRYTPEILFEYDPSVEYAIHIEEVFQALKEESQEPLDEDEHGWPSRDG